MRRNPLPWACLPTVAANPNSYVVLPEAAWGFASTGRLAYYPMLFRDESVAGRKHTLGLLLAMMWESGRDN